MWGTPDIRVLSPFRSRCCSVGGVNYGNQRHTPTHNRTQSTASFGIGRLPPLPLPPIPTGNVAGYDDVEVNYDLYRRLHPMPSTNATQVRDIQGRRVFSLTGQKLSMRCAAATTGDMPCGSGYQMACSVAFDRQTLY